MSLPSAIITNISVNNASDSKHNGGISSINSSLSSSSSSYSIPVINGATSNGSVANPSSHKPQSKDYEKENDSGIEKDNENASNIFIRVNITDQNLQVNNSF